ncbi:MAG: hypothetical protein RLY47_247 [Candidatus Parcubacteria bacterium]|jgi:uncharacterized membrane protein YgcG
MKSRSISTAFFLFAFFTIVPFSAHGYTFSRDLKLGDSGEDVRALQMSLNANTQTRVAASGVGSPGQETNFFGEKTQSAVIRYQNLHADDILRPIGLAVGTGYVGAATRNRLSGNTGGGTTTKKSLNEAIAAFDTALGVSPGAETNRSPVDDPRIPKTEDELIAAVDDFAGSDVSDAEIVDFSRQMVIARYGYSTEIQGSSGDDDESDTGDGDDDGGGGSSGGQEFDTGGSGAGCIGLLLSFLGL